MPERAFNCEDSVLWGSAYTLMTEMQSEESDHDVDF